MKKVLALVLALCLLLSLAACGGGNDKPKESKAPTYPKLLGKKDEGPTWIQSELYVWNYTTEKKVYTYEFIPKGFDKAGSTKLPVILYAHGAKGNADSLISEPKILAEFGIAGFTFECCGGSSVTPMSDLGSASTSSRASDIDAVLQYVKTLDWVDKDKIFIYGQSMGGMAVQYCAPKHNDDIAGMIIESMGYSGNDNPVTEIGEGDVAEFMPAIGQSSHDYVTSYTGDIICCCSVGDAGPHAMGIAGIDVYNARPQGSYTFYSCPEGAHTFNSFSAEGQKITIDAMKEFVLGK